MADKLEIKCIWCEKALDELETKLVTEKKLDLNICLECAQTRETRLRSVFKSTLSPEQKNIFEIYENVSKYITSNVILMT